MGAADSEIEWDVVIVGLGPVGAALANLLGMQGVRTLVLERWDRPFSLPRAVHFDGEAMRLFQTIGIADSLKDQLFVNKGMRFVTSEGGLLVDWPRPQEVGPHLWHASYRFHQPTLELKLRMAMVRHPCVAVRYGVDVCGHSEEGDRVLLALRPFSTEKGVAEAGPLSQVSARYVVGCDGARSNLRDWIGGGVVDFGSDQDWLVVDVMTKRQLTDLSDWTIQYCDPRRPTTVARGVGLRRRWEFMVMPGDDVTTIAEPDTVWRLLERWIGPGDAEIERASVYRFHAVLAERWRRGCLLIAGDAAHQTPPFLGQGLCAGLRDVANLGWKLGAVIAGRADPGLLDSYEAERKPHARDFICEALRLGNVLQAIDEDSVERSRDTQRSPQAMESIAPRLGPGLHGDRPPPAGALFGQPRLPDGRRLDDVVGLRFCLFASPEFVDAIPPADRLALDFADVPILAASRSEPMLDALGTQAVLVRPDRAILGVTDTPAGLGALIGLLPFSGVRSVHDAIATSLDPAEQTCVEGAAGSRDVA